MPFLLHQCYVLILEATKLSMYEKVCEEMTIFLVYGWYMI